MLFENAINPAKLAQKTSTLDGILWHQDENDSTPDFAYQFREKFSLIVKTIRSELNVLNLPILIGGLGDFLTDGMYGVYFSAYQIVNKALQDFAQATPNCYFVTASGLTSNPDFIHIDAPTKRKFGIRYFEAFNRQEHILERIDIENETLKLINNRMLSNTEKIGLLDLKFSSGALSLENYKIELTKLKQ